MRTIVKQTLAIAAAAGWLFLSAGAQAAELDWARSCGASAQAPTAANGPFPGSPTFHDQTIRQVIRLSGGGHRLRVRFTNEFGNAPVAIGGAHPSQIRDGFHMGDHLHGNDAGYKALADSIDLSLFR